MNFSTLYTILVTLSLSNPRVYTVNNNTFLRRYGKNWHIIPNISERTGPILTYFTGLVVVLVGMIIPILYLQYPKVRCCGKQLNLGYIRRHRQERPLLFAPAFDSGFSVVNPLSKD